MTDDLGVAPAPPRTPITEATPAPVTEATPADEATTAASPRRRPGSPVRPARAAPPLTPERIVAVDPPRDVRLSPDGRTLALTIDHAGARQLCVTPVRGGWPRPITSGSSAVTDPRWSPDGRRLAFVRDESIWVVEVDGGREVRLVDHPAGSRAPRWSPDGLRISFISRRRGWDQVWLVDAPVPRRGRPPASPKPPVPTAVTPAGVDVEDAVWAPDGGRLAVAAQRSPESLTSQVWIVDLASGEDRVITGDAEWAAGPRWLPDGSGVLCATDADGWLQVVRISADGRERTVLTATPLDHGDLFGNEGWVALPSPEGTRFVHLAIHDGLADVIVAPLAPAEPVKRPRGRPPKVPRPIATGAPDGAGAVINPGPGVWRPFAWLPDGSAVLAIADGDRAPKDVWLLPVPAEPPPSRRERPRQVTVSLPTTIDVGRFVDGERVRIAARDGLAIEATLYRPADASGRRGGRRVPVVVHVHGGPNSQTWREWNPFRQLLVQEGIAVLSVDFRGSTGHGRAFRLANRGEWGHADAHDVIDAARWAADQAWCDGRLGVFGGSYGGYLVLCAMTEEPGMWKAGVDLYGDSEIAESFRHGDRAGRLDLRRQMGDPDDPETAALFRRGSPVYRAERIEAPLLILHGRKDKRVVPLMTERIVEALEIEGKHHEVRWYDDEGHGWQRRENQRDAFERILAFLRRHLLEEPPKE